MLTRDELEARLLYAMIVAGKSARFADEKTKLFLSACGEDESPFDLICRLVYEGRLEQALKKAKTGNYRKLNLAFTWLAVSGETMDLDTVTPQELERIPGVGPKTSRFFILWTRPEARYAALDVHILRWLRGQGYLAPWQTPQDGETYARWEKVFLEKADALGLKPAELDARIWSEGSRRSMSRKVSPGKETANAPS